jgi:hypothetical protein
MDRPRLIRGLGIAWSMGCGLLCVLVIASWIRSYRVADSASLQITGTRSLNANSVQGVISIESMYWNEEITPFELNFDIEATPIDAAELLESRTSFDWEMARGADGGSHELFLPHWCPVLLLAMFAAAPWFKWRFTLRTLLIATTLIAVVLGLAVWARW